MASPHRTPRAHASFPRDRKQHMLDNFDLEVSHKTRQFRSGLATLLESFARRQETEVMRVPKELRALKMRDLNAQWGGSWAVTLGRIKEAAAKQGTAGADDEVQAKVDEMRKRKRGGVRGGNEAGSEAGPSKRTMRAPAQTAPGSAKRPNALASTPLRRTTRTRTGSTATTPALAPAAAAGSPTVRACARQTTAFPTSSFQPALPPAPPRLPRPDESLRSANGSPLANPYSSDNEGELAPPSVPSSDDELEDAHELEARMLAEMAAKKSMRPAAAAPGRGRSTRASFIRIRPSVSGAADRPSLESIATPKAVHGVASNAAAAAAGTTASPATANAANLMRIALPDGGTLEFDPLTIEDPLALEEEMRAKGLDEAQITAVRAAINARVQAMMAQFSRWKL